MISLTLPLDEFKAQYLPLGGSGVPTVSPCHDGVMLGILQSSIDEVATALDLNLTGDPGTVYEAKLDAVQFQDGHTWWLKKLPIRPLLTVEAIERYYGQLQVQRLSKEWGVIGNHIGARVHIVPSTKGGELISPATAPVMLAGRYLPASFKIRYTAGFAYLLEGTITTTAGSKAVLVVPNDPAVSVEEAVSGFATSHLGLRNTVWLHFNNETHRVARVEPPFARLTSTVANDWTGPAYILAYPEPIRRAILALAAIHVLEQLASKYALMGGGASLSIDALAQSKRLAVGNGYGVYSPLVQRNIEAFKRNYELAWNTWGPFNWVVA